MIIEILKDLLPANPGDPKFLNVIMEKPWKDPVPAIMFIWGPLIFALGIGINRIYSRLFHKD